MAETVSTARGSGDGSDDLEPAFNVYGDPAPVDMQFQAHSYEDEPRLHLYDDPDVQVYDDDEPQDQFHVYGETGTHVYEDGTDMSRYGGASSVMVEVCDDSVMNPDSLPSPPPPPPRQSSRNHPRRSTGRSSNRRSNVAARDLEAGMKKSKSRRMRAQDKHLSKSPSCKAKRYNPSLPEPKREPDNSCSARSWKPLSWFATFLIPDAFICVEGEAAKQAWREKVAIFEIMIIANATFLLIFGVFPMYFCRDGTPLSEYEDYVDPACTGLEWAMYGLLYFIAGLLLLQCVCSMLIGIGSLMYRLGKANKLTGEAQQAGVMVMVPCYNEGDAELRKTIKSILNTDYPDENKVLVVVADGIITGRGEWINTPRTLANLLGFEVSTRDKAYAYKSIGAHNENRASLYHGTYEHNGKSLKYIVIIKRGLPEEKNSAKPGNRGKRDSQLITLGLMNRVHHDRKLSELDEAICHALNDLHIPAIELEYLLAIDADTRVSESSISYMVHHMDTHPKVLACCGETRVDNKTQSWVTMIQVYEYFASHHLKKAFESCFGCVTCLPGCFTMYRMFDDDWRPLVSADNVYQSYARNDIESLHEKNLYLLGEDRMLTTLLLSFFSDMRLSFIPVAACWTIVPSEFKVLLSQRRRWVNSTFHNMWELLKVNTMCGICCLSMNAIVLLDMISTMILPASVVYAVGFVYGAIVSDEKFSTLTLILYCVLLGTQVAIFLVRSRIDFIFWFLIYLLLGIPVFYFILPLYSFWHMDDLSWGTTRQVTDKTPKGTTPKASVPVQQSQQAKPDVQRSAVQASQKRSGGVRQSERKSATTRQSTSARQSLTRPSASARHSSKRQSSKHQEPPKHSFIDV